MVKYYYDVCHIMVKSMIEINQTSITLGSTETLIIFGLLFAYLVLRLRRKII